MDTLEGIGLIRKVGVSDRHRKKRHSGFRWRGFIQGLSQISQRDNMQAEVQGVDGQVGEGAGAGAGAGAEDVKWSKMAEGGARLPVVGARKEVRLQQRVHLNVSLPWLRL